MRFQTLARVPVGIYIPTDARLAHIAVDVDLFCPWTTKRQLAHFVWNKLNCKDKMTDDHVWKQWGVYVVSYRNFNYRGNRSSTRLDTLLPTLRAYGMSPRICSGDNASMEGQGTTGKVWLTHTAALVQHAAGPNADQPCLVLEDDVEFLVDAPALDKAVRAMLARRPDFKQINLGAFSMGITTYIGGGLALSQFPILAQSILYSSDFCRLVANKYLTVARPDLAEGCEALALQDRLVAYPPLTTQFEWPRGQDNLKIGFASFRDAHDAGWKASLAIQILIVFGFLSTLVACALKKYMLAGVVGALSITALIVFISLPYWVKNEEEVPVHGQDIMQQITQSRDLLLDDFCPCDDVLNPC